MGIATELDKRTGALRTVLEECNDALFAQAMGSARDLSTVPEQIRGMQNLRVLRGSYTPEADSTDLRLPIPGYPNMVNVCQKEIAAVSGTLLGLNYDKALWKNIYGGYEGVIFVQSKNKGLSGTVPQMDGACFYVPTLNNDFHWVGGKEYLWEAYYWQDLSETLKTTPMGEAVTVDGMTFYGSDLSTATAVFSVTEGINAYLIPISTGGYRLALIGQGEARLYVEKEDGTLREIKYSDPRPWDSYNGQIYEIYTGSGITAIGDALFTKLSEAKTFVNRSSELKSIGKHSFYRCLKLQKATGLRNVETLGDGAFLLCPALTETDLTEAHLKEAGFFATHMSSLEDGIKLSDWDGVNFGLCANRRLKWGAQLEQIQNTPYTGIYILDCPNAEEQSKYPDLDFNSGIKTVIEDDGTKKDVHYFGKVGKGGCVGLSLYHAYNAYHATDGKARASFEDFWVNMCRAADQSSVQDFVDAGLIDPLMIYNNGEDATDGYVEGVNLVNGQIYFSLKNFHGGTDEHEILGEMVRRLSAMEKYYGGEAWSLGERIYAKDPGAKAAIDASLKKGIPVLANVNHMGLYEEPKYDDINEGDHEVCIIGCDEDDDKLVVVDSTDAAGEQGHIYKIAYEDLFYGYESSPGELRNSIRLLTIGGENE